MGKQRDKGLPPEVTKKPQPLIITQERYYKLITPLFGGGAVTGEPDAVTVVRGTEIRGHLRFWWRACFGGRYVSVKDMKKDEDLIWGAAAKTEKEKTEKEKTEKEKTEKEKTEKQNVEVDKQPEAVQIMVEVLHRGTPIEPFPLLTPEEYKKQNKGKETRNRWEALYNKSSGVPQYAAFTLQLTSAEKQQKDPPIRKRIVYENIEFRLVLSFPERYQHDIEGALWAWETFGGIGARTRRGFGALQLTQIDKKKNTDVPTTSNAVQWIREHIIAIQTTSKLPVKGKAPKNIPCLLPDMKIKSITPSKDATLAWEAIVGELSRFRQVPDGRASQFAASQWPEADTIRGWYPLPVQTMDGKGSPSSTMPQKFPRAAFGLPIIFNFIKRSDLQKRPLQGKNKTHERLASSLLLRPLLCEPDKDKNTAIGLAIVLENFSFPPEGIVFIGGKDEEPHTANPYITEKEAKRVKPLQGESDVLKAFMNYLEGK